METDYLIKAILSLIFVVALIGVIAFVLQKFVLERNLFKKGAPKRLRIEEFLYLDGKRKLALVKKDDQEFLILLSPNSETVIDGNDVTHNRSKTATK